MKKLILLICLPLLLAATYQREDGSFVEWPDGKDATKKFTGWHLVEIGSITTNIVTVRDEAAWTNWYTVKVQLGAVYGYAASDSFEKIAGIFMASTNSMSAKHALLAFKLWDEAGKPEPWTEPQHQIVTTITTNWVAK